MKHVVSRLTLLIAFPPLAPASALPPDQAGTASDRQIDPRAGVDQIPQAASPKSSAPAGATQSASSRDAAGTLMPVIQVAPVARPLVTAGPQLSSGRPTAQPPAPLSRPADGRPQAIVRIEGEDRCDPAAKSVDTPGCRTIVETRASEFPGTPRPVLTSEQRLSIGQRLREASGSVEGAARRIDRTDVDPAAADVQALAAMVQPEATTVPEPWAIDKISPEATVILDAVLGDAQASEPPR